MKKNRINPSKKESKNNILYELISSPKERLPIFRRIPANDQGFALLNLSKHFQEEILNKLKDQEILNLLRYLDPDEAADLLQNISNHRRKRIIKKLSEDIKEKVEFLLKFNPKTAAGMMSLDYIEINKDLSFKEISRIILKHEKRTGKFPTILAVKSGFLAGELPGHVLALHKGKEKIDKYIKRAYSVKYDAKEREVIGLFKKHLHDKIVVLDEDKSILGVIYSDDILKLIQKQPAAQLYDFAGVSEEEDVLDPVISKVKHRYKWLIINLFTAFLAASVVGLFRGTISKFVLLAVYMPVIAGMGGNTGTQTLAVLVRGIALKRVELKTGARVIMKEMMAGAINGIIIGAIVALVTNAFNQNPMLGLIVGVSMVINLMIAGLFGSIIPLIMKRLGKDPATSATVFITTATDLFGFFIFLGLATLVF